MANEAKKVTLANANFKELCDLPRDHFEFGDFSIMTDSTVVWLSEHRVGEERKQHIEIPRRAFNHLIAKYRGER